MKGIKKGAPGKNCRGRREEFCCPDPWRVSLDLFFLRFLQKMMQVFVQILDMGRQFVNVPADMLKVVVNMLEFVFRVLDKFVVVAHDCTFLLFFSGLSRQETTRPLGCQKAGPNDV
jgi:hypothetical protein